MNALDLVAHAVQVSEKFDAAVFPVRVEPHPKEPGKTVKIPQVRAWQDVAQKFTTSAPNSIESLFERCPNATHVGVRTGGDSRLLLIDLDGAPGIKWWRENAAMLPPTRTQRTRRTDGKHLYYRLPVGVELRNSAGKIAVGVDIRASGGFAVDWSTEFPPDHDEIVEAPSALVEYLQRFAARKAVATSNETSRIAQGRRNDYLSKEAFRLRKQGLDVAQILTAIRGLNGARCNPPLDDTELQQIAQGKKQIDPEPDDAIAFEDFYAVMPMHAYVYVRNGEMWPAPSVNARLLSVQVGVDDDGKPIKMKAATWLDKNRPVEQLTWAPGEPQIVANRLVSNGGWIERTGVSCFNLYLPPIRKPGDPHDVAMWVDHVYKVFGDDALHIVRWLAHRVQRPGEKINHALVLGGAQGIGKDTILEPVKHAIGPWNCQEVSPTQILGRFNGFLKSVILRISEARDLGDFDRFSFYDHMKAITAAPPDVLRCDEKHIREHHVFNVTGVIITTNNKTNGIYLPADDRRHFVAWSNLTKEQFSADYWNGLYRWYTEGGIWNVCAYLEALDLSDFDPKAPPPKTPAFHDIVDANRAPEDAEVADAIDALGNPDALTLVDLITYATVPFGEWLKDRRNSRQIPHRLETAGYVPVRKEGTKDGYWEVDGRRQTIYARRDLSVRNRYSAALGRAKPAR